MAVGTVFVAGGLLSLVLKAPILVCRNVHHWQKVSGAILNIVGKIVSCQIGLHGATARQSVVVAQSGASDELFLIQTQDRILESINALQ